MQEETKNSHEFLLKKAYLQMAKGCSRKVCLNPYCRSNPSFPSMSSEDCEAYVLHLAASVEQSLLSGCSNFIFCMDSIVPKELFSDFTSNRSVLIFFSNVENIGFHFLAGNPSHEDPMIDWQEYDSFVSLISLHLKEGSLRDDFFVQIINEFRLTNYSKLYLPRCCLLLMNFIGCLNSSTSSVARLCGLVCENKWMNEQLSTWVDSLEKDRFEKILKKIQEALGQKAVEINSQNGFDEVFAMLKVIDLMWNSNNRKEKVSYKGFYNGTINKNLSVQDEYRKWKQPSERKRKINLSQRFSFIDFPWVIDCANKIKLLHLENFEFFEKELGQYLLISFFSGNFVSPYLQFEIRRDFMIEDTLAQLSLRETNLKKPLKIKFIGEEGVDEGGVKKEFFQLIVKKIFEEQYEMFKYNETHRLYWFNPNCKNTNLYEMLGILLGLAIYNGINLDINFPVAIYKKLLNINTSSEDLKEFDAITMRSLEKVLEFNEDVKQLCLNFIVETDAYGKKAQFELVEGGGDLPVTDQNKTLFVELYTKWVLSSGIHAQFESFKKGFFKICGGGFVKLLSPREIDVILCGCSVFDLAELEKVAIYENGYTRESPTV